MTFNSILYLLFLSLAVGVFWGLPARFRRPFVLVASLGFYASWGLIFVWLPILVAGIVYVIGRKISEDSQQKKHWAELGAGIVLALLILFKYSGFLAAHLIHSGIIGWANSFSLATTIAFPLGISFYTFEAIAYLIDLQQKRVKLPGFFDLCLFFLFWPNILSGPLVRARELMPQLAFQKTFEPRFCFEGMDRFIWGLVQKNVVANTLGIWVDRGFAASITQIPTTLDGWSMAIAFGLQIYFDFAGYTNMAIGAARLLGVSLPENFRQPYHAATPVEFWSRWHMTLSRWVRDYLFFPINAKWAGAPLPLYASLIGVMGLVGLWHGAGWGFVLWGLLHGIYLVLYRVYESWKGSRTSFSESHPTSAIWRLLTLIGIAATWVPFRAKTLHQAGTILSAMFYRVSRSGSFGAGFYLFAGGVLFFCVIEPALMRLLEEIEEQTGSEGVSAFRVVVRPVAYLAGLFLFLVFDEHNTQFIYSQF